MAQVYCRCRFFYLCIPPLINIYTFKYKAHHYLERNLKLVVQAVRAFAIGDVVLEYAGILRDRGTADGLEAQYCLDRSKGCFLYYFQHMGQKYW